MSVMGVRDWYVGNCGLSDWQNGKAGLRINDWHVTNGFDFRMTNDNRRFVKKKKTKNTIYD